MRPVRYAFGRRRNTRAQTLVFFGLTLGTLFLLCGLAIDSGLLFLAKARMSRAVDGASLAAVGNFNNSAGIVNPTIDQITSNVALIMRNFAVANYTDLGYAHSRVIPDYPIPSTATEQKVPYTTTTGETAYNYIYQFNDGTKDANGQYRKFVNVTVTTGSGGQITSATCSARCPVQTYFIGLLGSFFKDLKVSAQSVATRNPRLIMIIVDRSASMLATGGGAYGLPTAIVQFLDFFDTSADYIGIVSFGSNARLEMPLTTNFIVAGTNTLFDSYQTNAVTGVGEPGVDPEEVYGNSDYDPAYTTSGVRRLKFGGTTAADDGMRLGMEELMNNSGFNDPDVVKYIVLFTDGAWNQTRTLLAAPGYTDWTIGPPKVLGHGTILTNGTGLWSTNVPDDTNLIVVPTFCEATQVTNLLNAISSDSSSEYFEDTLADEHTNDIWQSMDGAHEPVTTGDLGPHLSLEGAPMTIVNNSILGVSGTTTLYSRYIDVWLPPGAVDYEWHNNGISQAYVSDLTNPTQHIGISQASGDSNELVVPGYVADGLFFDGLDLPFPDNSFNGYTTFPRYKLNNYQEYDMWPDDNTPITTWPEANAVSAAGNPLYSGNSLERQLMFRNYPNLLTGFYISRPDQPLSPNPLAVDAYTGARRWEYGLGPYYPGAGVYWPFDLVGIEYGQSYPLTNAVYNPDVNSQYSSPGDSNGLSGGSRHVSFTINMQSADAAPEWSGEWFYEGTAGTTVTSSPGNTAVSTLITSKAEWQNSAPAWLTADFDAPNEGIMTNESAHNTNVIPTADVWRPNSFSGVYLATTNASLTAAEIITNTTSVTGGFVIDGSGNVYKNSMAYSGRPTHYFDFSQSKWIPVALNHKPSVQALPLGDWKVQEYAWHARNMGVTIFTVGYGYLVTPAQQVTLAQVANSTNTTAGNPQGTDTNGNFFYTAGVGTAISYNPSQPIGQQFYATNSADISNDFYQVGQAINAALTQ